MRPYVDIMPIFPEPLRKNDDIFIRAASERLPFVFTYEQKNIEIVRGPSCRIINNEIFVDRCESDNVSITERRGGGGTVVLSPGVLVTIVAGEKKNPRETATDIFHRIHDRLIVALCKAGIKNIAQEGISDLAANGKKILGSSLYIGSKPQLFYYQSSLLVSCDISLMDRYLRHPPREPSYRQGRGHSEFCTTLRELGLFINISDLSELIETELKRLA
jgi:lipoate-protein ligase A